MTALTYELVAQTFTDTSNQTNETAFKGENDVQSPADGAEIMLRAVTTLDDFKSKYPHPHDLSHWDQDARHTRVWLESNQAEIQAALERMLANVEFSRADVDEQIRLLFESLNSVPVIRQANENYIFRSEHPSEPAPERIAVNRARHELLQVVSAGLRIPLKDPEGKPADYIGHYDVAEALQQIGIDDPARARISTEHAELIHKAHLALKENQAVLNYGPNTNRWFDAWVAKNHPGSEGCSGKEYIDLFAEWYGSPDYQLTRTAIKAPVYAACEALGMPNIVEMPTSVRNTINQDIVTELKKDLSSDDLRYDAMREPLKEADRTTTELLRQISAFGYSDRAIETVVKAKVYKANQTAIEVVAGLLYAQQSGESSLPQDELAIQLDLFARAGTFMYAVEVNPLPEHDRSKDLTDATALNRALRSFVLADAIAKTAVRSTDPGVVQEHNLAA